MQLSVLDFNRLRIILDTIILAAADRFCFADTIKSQNLLITEQTVQCPRNRPCFEHRAAPAHHPGGWPNVLADIYKVLLLIFATIKWHEDDYGDSVQHIRQS